VISKLLLIQRKLSRQAAATATEAITTTRESDDGSINSSNSGLLFPPSFSEMLDEQN